MDKYEIRFGGFGGQGVVLAGVILAKAASLEEGKNALQTQLYGPESRGGAAKSEVIISEAAINHPKVELANLLIIMSQEAGDIYGSRVTEDAVVIYDADLVEVDAANYAAAYSVPATRIAEGIGNKIAANMVMLGAIVAATGIISFESLIKTIKLSVPGHAVELNTAAAQQGYDAVNTLKGVR